MEKRLYCFYSIGLLPFNQDFDTKIQGFSDNLSQTKNFALKWPLYINVETVHCTYRFTASSSLFGYKNEPFVFSSFIIFLKTMSTLSFFPLLRNMRGLAEGFLKSNGKKNSKTTQRALKFLEIPDKFRPIPWFFCPQLPDSYKLNRSLLFFIG